MVIGGRQKKREQFSVSLIVVTIWRTSGFAGVCLWERGQGSSKSWQYSTPSGGMHKPNIKAFSKYKFRLPSKQCLLSVPDEY